MAKQYTVTIWPRTSRQLLAHAEFLSRKSINAAIRLSSEFKAVIQALQVNPFQFPIDPHSELENPPHVALFAKRYQIYFDVEDQDVFIGAVRDCRQEPQNHYS